MVHSSTHPDSQESFFVVEPFLHFKYNVIYNPLTDLTLLKGEKNCDTLLDLVNKKMSITCVPQNVLEEFKTEAWIIPSTTPFAGRFHLKYVSLETHTLCNQSCYFCPVSIQPREKLFMSMELFECIIRELTNYRATLTGVSLSQYNEPTLDPRLIDQLHILQKNGIGSAILTNGTGLTQDVVDGIRQIGLLKHLTVNLPTLDRIRYQRQRNVDHLEMVLENLNYLLKTRIAETMEIVVLGTGDEEHKADTAAIEEHFSGSLFNVQYHEVMNRAGNLPIGLQPGGSCDEICGCEQTGSRPIQWLHITANGECVLCCQDYKSRYVTGNLNHDSVDMVMSGPRMSRFRKWTYGLDKAPKDFICHNCIYSLRKQEKN